MLLSSACFPCVPALETERKLGRVQVLVGVNSFIKIDRKNSHGIL